ncbi:MAG: hypothetical protein N3G48_00900 [Sulfolobales archaeon]|nr:hypothetical protein [Sulfolobales archaeon]
MSRLCRLLSFTVLTFGILGMFGSFYIFGLKAVTTSLARDMIGNAILRIANLNITAYEGIKVVDEWLDLLSSLSNKLLILLLIYSLLLISFSTVVIKSCCKRLS